MWEGVLFHLALLLCARQVVKRREGLSEQKRGRGREGEREREGCRRKRNMEKEKGGKGRETVPGCPSAVSQNNIQDPLMGIVCLSVQLWQRAHDQTHCNTYLPDTTARTQEIQH